MRISSLPRLIIFDIVIVLFVCWLSMVVGRACFLRFDFYWMTSMKRKKRGTAVLRSKSEVVGYPDSEIR